MLTSSPPPLAARLTRVGFWFMLIGSLANLARRLLVGNEPVGLWGVVADGLRLLMFFGMVLWVVGRVWAWRASRP